MMLTGSIQRFRVSDVLQFLAAQESTGILEIRDFEEYGYIYLINGRVEAISLPITDEKLGSRLVHAGLLTETQLANVLLEHSQLTREERRRLPLGQMLVDRGYTDEDAVRRIMVRQTHDQVFELAHWRQGMFIYDEVAEDMPTFAVKVHGDVTELLLDAYRRIDEGERARKAKERTECEVCYRCPTQEECSELIRVRFLRPDHCLWRELAAVLDEDYEQLRNARNLYRSRQRDAGPELAALNDGALMATAGVENGDG